MELLNHENPLKKNIVNNLNKVNELLQIIEDDVRIHNLTSQKDLQVVQTIIRELRSFIDPLEVIKCAFQCVFCEKVYHGVQSDLLNHLKKECTNPDLRKRDFPFVLESASESDNSDYDSDDSRNSSLICEPKKTLRQRFYNTFLRTNTFVNRLIRKTEDIDRLADVGFIHVWDDYDE